MVSWVRWTCRRCTKGRPQRSRSFAWHRTDDHNLNKTVPIGRRMYTFHDGSQDSMSASFEYEANKDSYRIDNLGRTVFILLQQQEPNIVIELASNGCHKDTYCSQHERTIRRLRSPNAPIQALAQSSIACV